MPKYTYEVLDGFFELTTWDEDVRGPFGLQSPSCDWRDFAEAIKQLQSRTLPGRSIKVIYLGRHGQGATHNLQADEDGLPMIESQKRKPTLDPPLTELGREQALKLRTALQREVGKGMPLPEKLFVSPLRRAGETCQLEWSWLFEDPHADHATPGSIRHSGVPVTVIENIRERLHVLPCNGRSAVTKLKQLFPLFHWPESMPETDTPHLPEGARGQETVEEMRARAAAAWDEIMDLSGSATYISLTCHGKFIRSLLVTLGLQERRSALGSLRVIVVRTGLKNYERGISQY